MSFYEQPQQSLSVSEVVSMIGDQLNELGMMSVQGEISQFKSYAGSSGHWYFSIKDDDAQLECIMWRSRNASVRFAPKVGDKVRIRGNVSIYEKNGKVSFNALTMERSGDGELYQKFLELRSRLLSEGLFDEANKKPFPKVPMTIGLITGRQTAAKEDVYRALREHSPYVSVILYPTQVQGLTAADQIVRAIERANRDAVAESLLLVRGGGSIEDLWCFNEEKVARAIRASHIPILTGIGHETDTTIADLAADGFFPTPTAAARGAAESRQVLLKTMGHCIQTMRRNMEQSINERLMRLDDASEPFSGAEALLSGFSNRFQTAGLRLLANNRHILTERQRQVQTDIFNFRQNVRLPDAYLQEQLKQTISSNMKYLLQSQRYRLNTLCPRKEQLFSGTHSQKMLEQTVLRIQYGVSRQLKENQQMLASTMKTLRIIRPTINQTPVKQCALVMKGAVGKTFELRQSYLKMRTATLNTLDPNLVMKMGFARVEQGGMVVDRAEYLNVGDEVLIRFIDGCVTARVVKK